MLFCMSQEMLRDFADVSPKMTLGLKMVLVFVLAGFFVMF